jgi:hypothetical protein
MTTRAAVECVSARPRTEIGWGGRTSELSSPAAAGTMGSTLETLIQRLWEGLWAGGAPCPLCAGQLRLQDGRGVCSSCGSALS